MRTSSRRLYSSFSRRKSATHRQLAICLSLHLLFLGPVVQAKGGEQRQPSSSSNDDAESSYRDSFMHTQTGSVPSLEGLKPEVRLPKGSEVIPVVAGRDAQQPLLKGPPRGGPKVINPVLAVVTVLLLVFVAFCFSRVFHKRSNYGPQLRRLAEAKWTFVGDGACTTTYVSDDEISDEGEDDKKTNDKRKSEVGKRRETTEGGDGEDLEASSEDDWEKMGDFLGELRVYEMDQYEGQEEKTPEPPGGPQGPQGRESQQPVPPSSSSSGAGKKEGKKTGRRKVVYAGMEFSSEEESWDEDDEVDDDVPSDPQGAGPAAGQQPQPNELFRSPTGKKDSSYSSLLKRIWAGMSGSSADQVKPTKDESQGDGSQGNSRASSMYRLPMGGPLDEDSDSDNDVSEDVD
ncbi:hypothetical protein ACSSS7_001334 [Eimeria intestinalis]